VFTFGAPVFILNALVVLCRAIIREPETAKAVLLLLDSLCFACGEWDVRDYIYTYLPFVRPLMEEQYPMNVLKCELYRQNPPCLNTTATMLFMLYLMVHTLFILKTRHAVVVLPISIFIFVGIVETARMDYVKGCGIDRERGEYVLMASAVALTLITKYIMDSSVYDMFCCLEFRKQLLIEEKVHRCQAEFDLDCAKAAGYTPKASQYTPESNVSDDTSSEACTSGGVFKQLSVDVIHALGKLSEIGRKERWLIDSADVVTKQKLGCGSFGSVYAGTFKHVPVAIKLPVKLRAGKLEALGDELLILRQVRHPNIVAFYGACIHESYDNLALVLELVRGELLTAYVLTHDGYESESEIDEYSESIVPLVLGICHALLYLHTHSPSIVHGDLKPGNIMVEHLFCHETSTRAKLLDFGLSRVVSDDAKRLGGTKRWRAPEVSTCREPNTAADVFSFGLVVYFITSQSLPDYDFAQSIANTKLPRLPWDFCDDFRLMIQLCLSLEPSVRPEMEKIHDVFRHVRVGHSCQQNHLRNGEVRISL